MSDLIGAAELTGVGMRRAPDVDEALERYLEGAPLVNIGGMPVRLVDYLPPGTLLVYARPAPGDPDPAGSLPRRAVVARLDPGPAVGRAGVVSGGRDVAAAGPAAGVGHPCV